MAGILRALPRAVPLARLHAVPDLRHPWSGGEDPRLRSVCRGGIPLYMLVGVAPAEPACRRVADVCARGRERACRGRRVPRVVPTRRPLPGIKSARGTPALCQHAGLVPWKPP